jgi:hypothetical protein
VHGTRPHLGARDRLHVLEAQNRAGRELDRFAGASDRLEDRARDLRARAARQIVADVVEHAQLGARDLAGEGAPFSRKVVSQAHQR